ncbi:MAG TPA: hypothetical protein P5119_01070 [Candidatus Aminicenantes bacterium]|nr:hypothetical protein [Candidatus Aminicenantes bacterium]HRY63916.1 hypothetical protein [Candidatus Aminicenantes bacterium]HRZ70829.1 hypothetical protein [Candidatus Aminicenantes bacterium]
MAEPLVVEMMPGTALLWRCLHGGPLTAGSIDERDGLGRLPCEEFRDRNLSFLRSMTDTYGACAVVAGSGGRVVGHLRFYPKAVRQLAGPCLGLCLQQASPYGPAADFGRGPFPPLREIEDKTLVVHCMMVAPDDAGGGARRRKGIGTRMALTLAGWAAANGWRALEASAYEPLPAIYETSGQAGRVFWERLGFGLVRTEREAALEEDSDFVRRLRGEAAALGLDPARLANKYIMRLQLG